MGNSEVGHLNLGAGAVVKQDLTRIDEAVERRLAGRRTRCCASALTDAPRVHLIGLVSDGGVHSSLDHLEALIELAAEWACRTSSSTPSPTGATRRRPPAPASSAASRAGCASRRGRVGSVVGRYFAMDRDKRWERTQRAYDLLVARRGRAPRRHRRGGGARRLRARRDRRVHHADDRRRGGADPPRRLRHRVQLPPRPHAPDHRAAKLDRGRRRPTRYTTLTEYEEDWLPGAFPPARPAMTLAQVIADRGRAPAARRRDREVPARDVLLQRRRGGPVRGRGARARALAARRADLRPQARDERARGGRRVRAALARATSRASRSSTSPTRTWSATPA